ncbi:lipopolysaccharide ABC transporter permease protein [Candidatus Termititenax persephonae]|uniref:Lipopolysaccharide ABC transporter permease protein n=1 Tax=Candidatus Termititenax persephonae TaxID=2218525 RepID=A0A388TF47_9BACT|nr:lipopolysaccharide ABC transporter permease protein [Candidatus Termititenax persephonae]
MKILDRYMLSELLMLFGLGMAALVIIGTIDLVFSLIDMFVNNGVPFPVVFKILIFKIPAIMVLFFPMAVLFAVAITLIRMITASEITALRAGGLSLLRITAPIVGAGVLAACLSFANNDLLTPWANAVSDGLIDKAVLKKPLTDILENTFFRESESRYFYIRRIDRRTDVMEDIAVYELTNNFPRVITAKRAYWDGSEWRLENGIIHKYDEQGVLSYQGNFAQLSLNIGRSFYNYYKSQKTPSEMSTQELRGRIAELRSSGVATSALQTAYHLKYSMPAACLIFALVGTALLLLALGHGRDVWSVVVAVILALLSVGFYFFLMAAFRAWGRGGMVTPFWAAWSPNFIYGSLAAGIIGVRNFSKGGG